MTEMKECVTLPCRQCTSVLLMRLLILILPLLVLWGVWEAASSAEGAGGLEGKSRRGARAGSLTLESVNSPRERGADSRRNSQHDSKLLPLEGVEPGKPIPSEWAGTPELLEFVWQKMDQVLLAQLSREEQEGLRSFIGNLTGPDAAHQPWVCWGPDVSLAKAEAYHEAEKLTGLNRSGVSLFANQFLSGGKWSRTATNGFSNGTQGLPVTLTWSIVPDGTSAPGLNVPGTEPSNLRSWLSSIYGGSAAGVASEQPWFSVLKAAFDEMEETCGVIFVYEPNDDGQSLSFAPIGALGVRGDIRLAARNIDGDSGTLGFAFAPDRGDLILDSSDSIFNTTSSASLRLHNTVTHELGHSLGLAHVCPLSQTKLMEPILTLFFRGPRFDEFQSLQRLYGDVFEHHSADRNNDTLARATPLNLIPDGDLDLPRLSIDDNSDVDYFRVSLLQGQKLSATLTPGEGSYLEGGTIGDSCSTGTQFDSATIHDLRLELFSADGSSLLEFSIAGGLGEQEQIDDFDISEDGEYIVRVNGGSANAAQLYRLNFDLLDRPPAPRLVQLSSSVIEESGSVKNGRLDPGETVKVRVVLKNEGRLATSDLAANVSVPGNVTLFSSTFGLSSLGPDLTSYLDLVFGATGDCGDEFEVNVAIEFGGGEPLVIASSQTLGSSETMIPIDLNFDGSAALPAGWVTSTTGAGVAWRTSSARSDSPLRSAFADNVNAVGQAILESPAVLMGSAGGNLTFTHLYRNEGNFDGGVLEASRNGGAWFDLPESAAEVLSGGYDATISNDFMSPIAGRRAWSGSRTDFLTTSINISAAWGGDSVRFRWVLAHDASTSMDGWYVDNVRVSTTSAQCEVHRPELFLVSSGEFLSENSPDRRVDLTVSAALPLMNTVPFSLLRSGSAGLADFTGSLSGILPSGQSGVSLPISVATDRLDEGSETLVFSLASNSPAYIPGSPVTVALSILDSSEVSEWMALFFPSPVPLEGDSDGDGFSEIAEYLLGTNPASRISFPRLSLTASAGGYLIPIGILPPRPDASLGVETSNDLSTWTSGSILTVPEGLRLEADGGARFFRLVFSLDE
jgi:hypothetical protein